METHLIRIKYRRSDEFHLHPFGDIHGGTIFCVEDKAKDKVKEINNDPYSYWWGMGDYSELIIPNDPRWDVEAIASWVERTNIAESQRKWVVKLFTPIKDKCWGLIEGNHESNIRLRNYQDIQLDICRDLGVKNLGASAFLRVCFERKNSNERHCFDIHVAHGSGSPQTEGGKIMRLVRGMMGFHADIYAMGHIHDIKTDSIAELYMDSNLNIKERRRVAVITGSWFKAYKEGAYASYAERKLYNPTTLGCPMITIRPDSGEIFATVS